MKSVSVSVIKHLNDKIIFKLKFYVCIFCHHLSEEDDNIHCKQNSKAKKRNFHVFVHALNTLGLGLENSSLSVLMSMVIFFSEKCIYIYRVSSENGLASKGRQTTKQKKWRSGSLLYTRFAKICIKKINTHLRAIQNRIERHLSTFPCSWLLFRWPANLFDIGKLYLLGRTVPI